MTARPEHRQPTINEINQFIADREIVFAEMECPTGKKQSVVGGNINRNDGYDAYMLDAVLRFKNDGREDALSRVRVLASDRKKLSMSDVLSAEEEIKLDKIDRRIVNIQLANGFSNQDVWGIN